jgi:hypothetical protein
MSAPGKWLKLLTGKKTGLSRETHVEGALPIRAIEPRWLHCWLPTCRGVSSLFRRLPTSREGFWREHACARAAPDHAEERTGWRWLATLAPSASRIWQPRKQQEMIDSTTRIKLGAQIPVALRGTGGQTRRACCNRRAKGMRTMVGALLTLPRTG